MNTARLITELLEMREQVRTLASYLDETKVQEKDIIVELRVLASKHTRLISRINDMKRDSLRRIITGDNVRDANETTID